MNLLFDATKIPRSTTREEWRVIWRWKRKTEKELAKRIEEKIVMLSVYGSVCWTEQREDIIDEIVTPPLLLGPHQ